jgi:hypothetical protein
MREKFPVIILRIITILAAIPGALVCVFAVPALVATNLEHFPQYAFLRYPAFNGLYAAAACFFYALVQSWLLLSGFDRDGSLSAKNLKAIGLSAIVFSVLYFIFAMPIVFLIADADDAPGLVLIGAFVNTLPIGVAALMAILERIVGGSKEKKQG